jgi:hypothetical protein
MAVCRSRLNANANHNFEVFSAAAFLTDYENVLTD